MVVFLAENLAFPSKIMERGLARLAIENYLSIMGILQSDLTR